MIVMGTTSLLCSSIWASSLCSRSSSLSSSSVFAVTNDVAVLLISLIVRDIAAKWLISLANFDRKDLNF